MTRIVCVFWLFFLAALLSGGLLGRYLAALSRGHGSVGIVMISALLALLFAFSLTVLIRIMLAGTQARLETKDKNKP
ncbi:hypothetical protein [Thermus scotoductus]|uniref:Uncharacterized protein n=1 Tax=Thermus scotoductus TaxID=37636 RepID=A0A430UTM1_THESC|nr:hypothetical protein [Thermus scotoductus]RTI12012.1 hypothetical protein CSW30_01650 [Thermus scotoductus]RTI12178.1 hypothetical protein CSW27_10850 [Thermus scotoductus]